MSPFHRAPVATLQAVTRFAGRGWCAVASDRAVVLTVKTPRVFQRLTTDDGERLACGADFREFSAVWKTARPLVATADPAAPVEVRLRRHPLTLETYRSVSDSWERIRRRARNGDRGTRRDPAT